MADTYELIDTAPLRDQRTMVDVTHPAGAWQTVEQVEDAWQRWADREGLTARRRRGDQTTDLRSSRKTIVVHISHGKWIGDCPDCGGGVAGWPLHPRGACLDCGTIFNLEYPSATECRELATLMQARPEPERNYFPHLGETVAFVREEQRRYQHAGRLTGSLDLATLKDTLSPAAFEELKDAGLVD